MGSGVGGVGSQERAATIFLCGDVMTGRGVDQVLPHPADPELHEAYVGSACDYVALAEEANGEVPVPVPFDYVWGDALAELERAAPDARIINLETSVTTSDAWEPKGINYRMHPDNVPCLTVAGIDCCVLANNHVLDWGVRGLEETLDALGTAGLRTAGAGRDLDEAWRPREFAHRLLGSGLVDCIHGHSSHHPRGIEIYEGKPILYGCGDLLSDYEGIPGHEQYRGDLALLYFATLDERRLVRLRLVPMRLRRFRLERASAEEASWLQAIVDRESAPFGADVVLGPDGALEVQGS